MTHRILGVLEHNVLQHIWTNYPEELYPQLLTLMEKFQIAFAVDGDVSSLVNVIQPNTEYEKRPHNQTAILCVQ